MINRLWVYPFPGVFLVLLSLQRLVGVCGHVLKHFPASPNPMAYISLHNGTSHSPCPSGPISLGIPSVLAILFVDALDKRHGFQHLRKYSQIVHYQFIMDQVQHSLELVRIIGQLLPNSCQVDTRYVGQEFFGLPIITSYCSTLRKPSYDCCSVLL